MGGKTAIAAGLVTGLIAGAALVGGVVVLAPAVGATPSPAAERTPPPAASPSPTAVEPSASAVPSDTPSASASVDPIEAFGVGELAPPLSLTTLDGKTVDISDLRGKPVWVHFMASSCLPCRDEIPAMQSLATRYADTGLVVIGVDVREDAATVDAFAKELGITYPVGLDTNGAAQSDWGADPLPVHFWIGTDGIVRDGAFGGIGPDVMARGLEAILPGVTVTP